MLLYFLIVLGTGYLMLTLIVAWGVAAFSEGMVPLFGKLFANLAQLLPGASGWPTVFDLRGHLGPVPTFFIAMAVLMVPFVIAGFQIRSHFDDERERVARRRRDEEIARDEEVRQRVRDRMRKQDGER
jgi:uncharacterized membrane protein YhdT